MRIASIAAACAALALSSLSTAQAATITWGPATAISADSDVATTGVLAYAYHWSPTAVDSTVNGVTFTGSTNLSGGTRISLSFANGGYNNAALPGGGLSAELNSVLSGTVYDYNPSGAGNMQVTLNNLARHAEYVVQVFVQVPGYGGPNWWYTILDGAVSLQLSSVNDWNGTGQYTIGTFTADALTQTINVTGWDGGGPPSGPLWYTPINALQLRWPHPPLGSMLIIR